MRSVAASGGEVAKHCGTTPISDGERNATPVSQAVRPGGESVPIRPVSKAYTAIRDRSSSVAA